jgi:hypothetical protein
VRALWDRDFLEPSCHNSSFRLRSAFAQKKRRNCILCRHSAGRILEALYVDPAATAATSGAVASDRERTHRELKAPPSR